MTKESIIKANTKYQQAHYSQIIIRVRTGDREKIKACADTAGVSMQRFILNCIEKQTGLSVALDDPIARRKADKE